MYGALEVSDNSGALSDESQDRPSQKKQHSDISRTAFKDAGWMGYHLGAAGHSHESDQPQLADSCCLALLRSKERSKKKNKKHIKEMLVYEDDGN